MSSILLYEETFLRDAGMIPGSNLKENSPLQEEMCRPGGRRIPAVGGRGQLSAAIECRGPASKPAERAANCSLARRAHCGAVSAFHVAQSSRYAHIWNTPNRVQAQGRPPR